MDTYSKRRSWSDSHLTAVKSALGKRFFAVSNLEQDTKFGFDLCIPSLNIAVRIRQLQYKAYSDFTLRSSGGGGRSEYAKLLDKTVAPDFIFYGYALDKDTMAVGYLIDVSQWRAALLNKEIRPTFRRNRDGSHFVAFPLQQPKAIYYTELLHYVEQIV